ncbi:MAG: Sua5/YciO/YrdC/YwlC family protein [Proteobacteria bacterium]|nr:Sua5/YciO/YrdC/YwlC family protein [Pseudomonadota bacterium]
MRQGVSAICSEGVVACPTEAVWGLSCDPFSELAVAQLLNLKRRPEGKGLILVAAQMSQLQWLLQGLPAAQRARLELSWPGPTTWLIPHNGRVPTWIHGDHDTVAVRVSRHPVIAALCQVWGGALVSSSANPAGAQPAGQSFQVRRYFGDRIDYLVPGAVGGAARPSIIKHLASDEVVRS